MSSRPTDGAPESEEPASSAEPSRLAGGETDDNEEGTYEAPLEAQTLDWSGVFNPSTGQMERPSPVQDTVVPSSAPELVVRVTAAQGVSDEASRVSSKLLSRKRWFRQSCLLA